MSWHGDAVVPNAELPLTEAQAARRAALLAAAGVSWPAVAVVMGHYHGWFYSPSTWRTRAVDLGLHRPNPNKTRGHIPADFLQGPA